MQPEDRAALEQSLWDAFVARLADHLAAQWPAMPERLGERYAAFVEHAAQQAVGRGLVRAAAAARWVNLCFVWGPGFQDKPGFEWSLGMLAAPRAVDDGGWAVTHRLMQRSLLELKGRADSRIGADALAAADTLLVDRFGELGRRGEMAPYEPPPLPRAACDLEAVELRLLQAAIDEHYTIEARADGPGFVRAPLPLPNPLRVDASRPLPGLIGALSHPPGRGTPARLQLRARPHVLCDADKHPLLAFSGTHGRWSWQGHETRAVSWPVVTLDQPPTAAPGVAVAEETSPDIFRVEVETCGLRDDGDALGTLGSHVWVWPAEQWAVRIDRRPPEVQAVTTAREPSRGSTRCRVERDGAEQDAGALIRGFDAGLDAASGRAMQSMLEAWTAVPGLSRAALDGRLALLTGRAAIGWGWQLGANGLDGRALMRVIAALELDALIAAWRLEGELAIDGSLSRVSVAVERTVPLAATLERASAEPPLLEALAPLQTSFRVPLVVDWVPLASDTGAVTQPASTAAGPTGALVGEAGLRPRMSGGSGFEWFAQLRLETVSVAVERSDPLLGRRGFVLPLLEARTLLDWRLA